MQFDYVCFSKRYAGMETDEILALAVRSDLTDDARMAMRDVLASRGIVGDRLDRAVLDARQTIVRATSATNECDYCGRSTLLGTVAGAGQKFCSSECRRKSYLHAKALELDPELIVEHAHRISAGPCPRCGCSGQMIEMRPVYTVTSAIYWHSSKREHRLACRPCAVRDGWLSIAWCLLFGWWSLPGLFTTPTQIVRNLRAIRRDSFEKLPSPELLSHAALDLAEVLDAGMRHADQLGVHVSKNGPN